MVVPHAQQKQRSAKTPGRRRHNRTKVDNPQLIERSVQKHFRINRGIVERGGRECFWEWGVNFFEIIFLQNDLFKLFFNKFFCQYFFFRL